MTRPEAIAQAWFYSRGWEPFAFQLAAWRAYWNGEEGLIHASTGTGKTYAACLGPLLAEARSEQLQPLTLLWITPLRALAADISRALLQPIDDLKLPWDVGVRTGDTPARERGKQKSRLPSILVTTPESLALILSRPDWPQRLASLRAIVVDEWHELLSTKRGVLVELCLARLRKLRPTLRTWGLSATLGNLDEAAATLLGPGRTARIIHGEVPKTIVIDSIIPPTIERFPWAGHLGVSLVEPVAQAIEQARSTLVFTNTRAQTELWYQALLQARPDWAGVMALHHGSLDREVRAWVEDQLRQGRLKCVVCTSSLDLGVDFTPVDRVLQIGSPKGVARLLQRAGRSGHQPGGISRVTCVPTNTLELVEIAAARDAANAQRIESRPPCRKPFDLLAQHLVTCALGGGFESRDLYEEVRGTTAFERLTWAEWEWALDLVVRGGDSLRAYNDFRRVEQQPDGRYVVTSKQVERRHRQAIGTIVSDAAILVRFQRGARLGTVEESFAARLRPGERFQFAGRTLEFIRLHEQTVWVRKARGKPTAVPRWMGGRMPLSSELATAVRQRLAQARAGHYHGPEMQALAPVMHIQAERSQIPDQDELLAEVLLNREGWHLFLYPFEGRLVHEGIAALLAHRLANQQPITVTMAVNDYGLELLAAEQPLINENHLRRLLSPIQAIDDLIRSVNTAELARRQFREVARVAGLIFPGLPHAGKTARQLQASATLFYNVFREHDPANLLLHQANQEVLERQFEDDRLERALHRMQQARLVFMELDRPSPLGFPLMVERLRESLSSESLEQRVRRMLKELELTGAA